MQTDPQTSRQLGSAQARDSGGGERECDVLQYQGDWDAFCRDWLALLCRQLGEVRVALLLMQQGHSSFVPAALWPGETKDVSALAQAAQKCLSQATLLCSREFPGTELTVAMPLALDGQVFGAIVLDLCERPDTELVHVMNQCHWGMGWLESLFLRRRYREDSGSLQRARLALDVMGNAAEQSRLDGFGLAVVNDLASRFACDRVSMGLDRKGRVRILALSHSAFFEKKSQLVASLENAMDEALDQRQSVTWPLMEGISTSCIAVAHKNLAGQGAACSVVLWSRGKGVGTLLFERQSEKPFSGEEVRSFEAIAGLLGPMLDSRIDLHNWFAGRLADGVRKGWRQFKDPRRPAFKIVAGILFSLLIGICVLDGEFRVSAKAVVEGEVQRALAAPFDGFIREAPVRAGMVVRKGQALATLDDRDLLLERERWRSERAQYDSRYREALSKHERASAQVSLAQMAEAESQLDLVDEKLSRAQLRAPFDGVVVSGDLTQLLGSPVEQGKQLFEIAPLDAYRVILKVDDRDIRHVKTGQAGRLVLTGLTGEALDLQVHTISMAQAEEGKNLFRVEAKLDRTDIALRPGMEGVGKISVGERSYAWIWTHRLWEWIRLQAWIWLP